MTSTKKSKVPVRGKLQKYKQLDPDDLVPAKAIAPLFKVKAHTVLRWARAGLIPCIRIVMPGNGRKATTRFRRRAIEKWIAERETGAVQVSEQSI
jgi:phage terminase Nu1 subunit (DNA packaging protein)